MEPPKPAHPKIPSPLPFLTKTPDTRQQSKVQFDHTTLWILVLFAIASQQNNILAIHQWIQNHARYFLDELNLRTRQGQAQLPSQATLYRFMWRMNEHIDTLEQRLRHWAMQLVKDQAPSGGVRVSFDGKVLRGSRRARAGETAVTLISVYVHELGLTLHQECLKGRESTQARRLVKHLKTLGMFIVTGDAAYVDRFFARAVLKAGGQYLISLRDNTADVLESAQWVFSLPKHPSDSHYEVSEVRSGEVWTWMVESRVAPPELTNRFPGAQQFVLCTRDIFTKATGELRSETDYALTSLAEPARVLATVWRGHWGVENRSHHKRDVIFGEDACRSRKAAQALAAVRNVVLGLFHVRGQRQVLAATRRFTIQPQGLPAFFGFNS